MFRLKSKPAFTLIETLVALSLIIVMAGSTIIANRAISQNTSNAKIQAEEQYLIDQEMAELKFLMSNNYYSLPIYPATTTCSNNACKLAFNNSNLSTVLITLNGNGSTNSNSFYSINLSSQCPSPANSSSMNDYLLTVSSSSNPSQLYFNSTSTFDDELVQVFVKSCANPNLQQSQSFFLTSL